MQRRWWVVVLAAILGALAGAAPAPQKAADSVTSYVATATVVLTSNDPTGQVVSDTINVNQLPTIAKYGDVPKLVSAQLGYGGNPQDLGSQVSINPDPQQNTLQITANGSTADQVQQLVDTYADVLTSYIATRQDELREQRLGAALDRLETLAAQIKVLGEQQTSSPDDPLVQAKLDAANRRYSVVFEQYDTLSADPRTISLNSQGAATVTAINDPGLHAPGSRRSRGLFGLLAGGALGLGAVFVLNFFDRRIRQRAQAEAILGVPVQLTIPVARRAPDRGVVVNRDRHDRISDAYRAMRSVLALAQGERADKTKAPVTLVLSSGPGDGKTTVSSNIAAAFAEAGSRTVAINTDFRRPALSKALGVYNPTEPLEPGKDGPQRVSPIARGLRVHDERLIDRESTPGDLARKTVHMLPWFTSTFDEVVIDTPPVSLAAEVLELLNHADTIVVVVRLGHTRIDSCAKTAETLRALGVTNFLLVVIGGVTDRGFTYYGYGYARQYQQRGSRRPPARPEPVPELVDDY